MYSVLIQSLVLPFALCQSEQAKATEDKIAAELKDLKSTLDNIQSARPFDQLTVDEVLAARPEIKKTVEEMVKKGKWTVPGYEEKFGSEYSSGQGRGT
jgi:F-type H+-transporting ATPase subunit d